MPTDTVRYAADVLRELDTAVRVLPHARTVELSMVVDSSTPWDTGHYCISAVYDAGGRPIPDACAELVANKRITALLASYLTEYDTLAQLVDADELDDEPDGQYFYRNIS